jgi:pimeloyl-ACP methyl ester carboxylesterase
MVEPVIQQENDGVAPAIASTGRRETWPSRQDAVASFKKKEFYQAWDPRVLDRWIEYGLRDGPDPNDKSVTLSTTKHQEVFMYTRPTYRGNNTEQPHDDKSGYVDFDPSVPSTHPGYPFYRPEPVHILKCIHKLRPSVLYIFGEKTSFSSPQEWAEKMSQTGVGVGGSGGVEAGRVKQTIVLDAGHFVAFEKVHECADSIAKFLGSELKRWRANAEQFNQNWIQKPLQEKQLIDKRWKENIVPNSKNRQAKCTTSDSKL